MFRRDLSIRLRLLLLVVVATAVATTISGGFALYREVTAFAEAKRSEAEAIGVVFASMAAEAARTRDEAEAEQVLRAMARLPSVRFVRLLDAAGAPVAEHGIGTFLVRDARAGAINARPSVLEILSSRTIAVETPVVSGGEVVGRIEALVSTEELTRRLLSQLGDSALALLLAGLIGVLAARSLRKGLARRIVGISGKMREVRETHDYGATLTDDRADEIGELAKSFNAMMGEIRDRDARLARHRETLEQEVADRTSDLRVARQAADDANEAKSRFLAAMSHEIRTPMNGVLVMAEMLAKEDLPPEQKHRAEIISRSGRNLLAIIDDILDFSKIEAGKIELESIPMDMGLVLSDQVALFGARAADKGVALRAEIAANVAGVEGDPVRMGQIVANLVSNALKFTHKGSVTVRAFREAANPAMVCVEVQDTGIGIPPEKLGAIFERFSQADASTTRKFGGTGLGLSISQRLVEAMGGEIGVRSETGKGSVFWFRLPLPPAAAPARPRPERAPPEVAQRRFRGRRVLVVDDGEVNREIARQALSRFGVAVEMATNGIEALSAMAAADFDLVLMDGSMPELDGFETTRRQRALDAAAGRPPRRIVALTAHVVGAESDMWREAGMDGILRKPFTLDTLAECLAAHMPEPAAAPAPHAVAPPAGDVRSRRGPLRRADDLLDRIVLKSFADMAEIAGPEAIRRIFALFADQSPPALKALVETARSGDHAETARTAHAMKSMCLSIGAKALALHLGDIERAARRGQLPDAASLARAADLLELSLEALGDGAPAEGAGERMRA
jgi:signal transduction histidine kinase/CheY-like chemotaxis protein/HPt (histidine-containing phosphotransfer) domain-containing protein